MILVFDVNTVWRRRPFQALARKTDVVGIAPADGRAARRQVTEDTESMAILPVRLLPGWASRTAWLEQRRLWRKALKYCKGQVVTGVVVTSPHYTTLLKCVPEGVRTFYYASDDYRSYEGWKHMAELEKQTVQQVDHSFFISGELAERARREYDVAADRISVSMNATEHRFFPEEGTTFPSLPPTGDLPRPIAGVVGGLNERLDYQLLCACADLPELGTLLLVGPLPVTPSEDLRKLLDHPKCVSVGGQPHGTIHRWFHGLDVGLIPYTDTELNRFCSPMRLFDHLASGVPLVATDACRQIADFVEHVSMAPDKESFLNRVRETLSCPSDKPRSSAPDNITWDSRAEELLNIMEEL